MPLPRLLPAYLALALLAHVRGGAHTWADDAAPPAAPAAPGPAKPASPPTPEQVADAALAAWKTKDDAALRAFAERDEPDPWLVADELIRRGDIDAAEAFAKAAPRVDVEKLPAYVASRRGKPDDPARRERLAAAQAALAARRWGDGLKALGASESGQIDDVVGVRLEMGRGLALRSLAELGASAAAFLVAGEGAGRLGWLARSQRAFNEAGQSAYAESDFACAGSGWVRALAVCEVRGDDGGAADMSGNIGAVHHALGEYASALAAHKRALATKEARGDKVGAAMTLANIGVVYDALGDYVMALATYERALVAQEALRDVAGAARTMGNMGATHQVLGNYALAAALHSRALAAKEALGDKEGASQTLANIGNVHFALGEYQQALAIYARVLAAEEARGDTSGAAGTRCNIGLVHYALGDYAQALASLERALSAQEAVGDTAGAAGTLGNIGLVHDALGDHAKALAFHERALAATKALGDTAGAAITLGNIGKVHYARGDYPKALAAFERALGALESVGDKPSAATMLGNIAGAQAALGDHPGALVVYERALAAQQALGNLGGVALTLGGIGGMHRALGDLKSARANLERAVRLARSIRAVPVLVAHLQSLAKVYLAMGASGRALGAAREALLASEALLGGLGDEEGARARATHSGLFQVGALAAARDEEPAEVCSFLESGRAGALLDALDKRDVLRWKAETLPEDLKAADAKAAAAERNARAAYEKALKGEDRKARTEAARVLDDALEVVRDVNARIQRENKRAAGLFYPRAKTIEQIQASLEPGEALVLYGLCMEEALALVVEPEGERLVALGVRKDVEAACEALALRKPEGDATEALARLTSLLVEPLAFGDGVKQVLVSPEGPLCFLPWGALYDRAVAVTPSGSTHALLRSEEREPGEGVLALGDPDYAGVEQGAQEIYYRGKTLSRLPATRGEVEQVGTVVLAGAEASEVGLREALPKQKRWRAVHLACHGLIDARRPGLSSLALTRAGDDDGFLTALEVLRMEVPADLAVLSACETATGKLEGGEGIVGLTRAFMYAGTPRVLCSLWKVDDEATAALMTRFYALWNPKDGTPGLSAAEALKRAQEHVRAQERWKHPYYWAAWVLWGLPS